MASIHSMLPILTTKLLGNLGLVERAPVNGEYLMDVLIGGHMESG